MRAAINAARRSSHDWPMAAAVLSGARVLAVAHNDSKTHPQAQTHNRSLHAEHAVLLAMQTLQDNRIDTMIVVRIKKDGQLALAKPCDSCMELIHSFKIPIIWWTDDKGNVTSQIVERTWRTIL